ncbi:vWA domain-containing protein [Nocardioides speluncae]|uniref:vWA domain-containing protein n=1 Tax=Nocardioides speluncae TaxID=2670337 RepID=UPI000D699D06|nr:VWA domain-containing protein [Nocardioides speluncae]
MRGGDELLLGFTRALRASGVPVTADRARAYLEAVAIVGIGNPAATYVAGRATLCGCPDDLARHDRVFDAWFSTRVHDSLDRTAAATSTAALDLTDVDQLGEPDGADPTRTAASDDEVLRHRDVATLSAAERQRLAALFATLPVRVPHRRAARRAAWHRGEVDASRTLRASLRRMGEPADIRWRRRRTRPRRVVLLVDVSGSMSEYADALLRVAHRMVTATTGSVEVLTIGTRLTRVTRALGARDPDAALAAAGEVVPDWSGGTRLGETLRAFVDRWGQRGVARGAVVVIFSDGWERGDPALLAEQLQRLARLAHRVVWVNPHRGKPGYEPVQRGVLAVLPHVDAFLAGHSLATYAELMEVVADA